MSFLIGVGITFYSGGHPAKANGVIPVPPCQPLVTNASGCEVTSAFCSAAEEEDGDTEQNQELNRTSSRRGEEMIHRLNNNFLCTQKASDTQTVSRNVFVSTSASS